eukprot:TRINITY_DN4675_c0_g1_i2.p1 TRINITY_DN4675_c0_g1~~TRINITY_DN4675_c0_g1_i2.p1  ORF type:complete len:132 (+),score=21.08 TRINITY_DN4675_c0_g1_i2:268-663(+)
MSPPLRFAVFSGIVGVGGGFWYVNRTRDAQKARSSELHGALEGLSAAASGPRTISWEERQKKRVEATVEGLHTDPDVPMEPIPSNNRPITAFIGRNWNKVVDCASSSVISAMEATPRKLREYGLWESDEPV